MGYKNKITNKVLGNEDTSNALMSNNILTNQTMVFLAEFLAMPRCVSSPLMTLLSVLDH